MSSLSARASPASARRSKRRERVRRCSSLKCPRSVGDTRSCPTARSASSARRCRRAGRSTTRLALAEKDFLARGEDNDVRWVTAYVRDSREWLYDWLTELGVSFDDLVRPAGNSVPRLHLARGKGLGLVEPIYRACLRHTNIRFLWATVAEDLIVREGRITGVKVRDLRRRMRRDLHARHVIVATGGFQSNLKTVLEHWPSDLPRPTRLLAGAAHSATGSGHDLVRRVNGSVSRLDHQWNYVLGLPDPRDPRRTRGLAAFNFNGIWVNTEGKRFTQEFGDEKLGLRALLNQPGGTYWSVFDDKGKDGFSITVAGWENLGEVRRLVYETPGVVATADSLDNLAAAIERARLGPASDRGPLQ